MHVWEWVSYHNGNPSSMGLYKTKRAAIKKMKEWRDGTGQKSVYSKKYGYYHDPHYPDNCDQVVKREVITE